MTKNKIADGLKKGRQEKGYSVKQVSEFLINKGFKAGEKTIYSWESGNSQPTPDIFLTLCIYYGIDDVLENFGYDELKSNEICSVAENLNTTVGTYDIVYKELGIRLAKLRKDNNLTQKQVAEILNTVQSTYSGYELGTRKINLELILKFSEIYDVSPNFLITGKEDILQKIPKNKTEVKEFVNVSPLALTVARKFDNAPLKEKNMVLMTLDLELLKEDTETNSISSVS